MDSDRSQTILVTGACGQIGCAVSRILRESERKSLLVDVSPNGLGDVLSCDLTSSSEVSRLFRTYPIGAVIHLAGILPTAFQSDPLHAADVNLTGSLALMRHAAESHVSGFVFASSMSVYGTAQHRVTEADPAIPDDAYGASKRAIESVGEAVRKKALLQFVSLRIARVVGTGIRKTSSSQWRSQIFEAPIFETSKRVSSIDIPFAAEARLSLVHVEDVARMLITLVDTPAKYAFYNTPAEIWTAKQLKEVVEELKAVSIRLHENGAQGGPICDGSRFAEEFGFQLRGLRGYLSSGPQSVHDPR